MRNVILDRLNLYFDGNVVLNRVPLLVGPSGVAKSALIKQSAAKHNFRVVDIRTAFISRLDIEGLTEKVLINGRYYSESAPMANLVKCTDAYINTMRRTCKLYESYIKQAKNKEDKEKLEASLKILKEEAKTPVLFFDEITRGEASVRQVLTKILTDKEFMGMPMSIARVVAATNAQVDAYGKTVDIYNTNDACDAAFYDRFESIYVSPESMTDLFLDYAEETFDPSAYEQAKKKPYDTEHFGENTTEELFDPYPCFRTWEMVSNYRKRGGKVKSFESHLIGGSSSLSMDRFLEEAISTNTPAMVVSPTGLGKSQRIKDICASKGYELISINLSEVDRVDLEGYPVKTKVLKDAMVGMALTTDMAVEIKKIASEEGLPDLMTIRAPKSCYVEQFSRALANNKKVVIFFDEFNRVQNPSIMSAIFQVISDNRLFGIDFDPKNVECILACNAGDKYGDVNDFDPALAARFAIWRVKEYKPVDVETFFSYMKGKYGDRNPVVAYLTKTGTTQIYDALKSVEDRTIVQSAPSSRAYDDLARTLVNIADPVLKGRTLISSMEDYSVLNSFLRYGRCDEDKKARVLETMRVNFKNSFAREILSKSEFKYLTTLVGKPSLDSEEIDVILKYDIRLWQYRRDLFSLFLGKVEGSNFADFYTTEVNK